jgi:hypothetical protein
MESERHVGDMAEAYAAGALTPEEQAAVEAHVARCAQCARRVGETEEALLLLERAMIPNPDPLPVGKLLRFKRRGIPGWSLPFVAAAALIVGLVIPHALPERNDATLAMIRSHFSHAQFSGPPTAPPAKVLYARDRSWYYVIVAGSHRYDVYGVEGSRRVALGTTQPRDGTSELFARANARFGRLELVDRGSPVEGAAIR